MYVSGAGGGEEGRCLMMIFILHDNSNVDNADDDHNDSDDDYSDVEFDNGVVPALYRWPAQSDAIEVNVHVSWVSEASVVKVYKVYVSGTSDTKVVKLLR